MEVTTIKKTISKKANIDELIVYWSPSVIWNKNNNEITIETSTETITYLDFVLKIFPEFYYLTQKGIVIKELVQHYSNINSEEIKGFILDIINKEILVDSILTPQKVFFAQERLFENIYSEEIFLDPKKYEQFRLSQLNRKHKKCIDEKISLLDLDLPDFINNRKTYRLFDEKTKIPFDTFSRMISVFKQKNDEGGIHYNYASAGGLYPIDIFIYVKENRIENVKSGLYYYNSIENQLQVVSKSCVITKDAHYLINKPIFESSAFSVFLVYDASVTMPKYRGMGYFYACIEVGIMVNLLTQIAEINQIGLCSIGEMNFNKVEKYFNLNKNQVFMHTIEVGCRLEE